MPEATLVSKTDPGLVEIDPSALTVVANHMAEQVCLGFRHHDRRNRNAAADAFFAVDRRQFAHLDDATARAAAEAYVDALRDEYME